MQLDHDKKQLKCTFLSLRNIVIVHCSQIYNRYLHAIVKSIKKNGNITHRNILGYTCIITLKRLNHEDLKSLDMKYFLYHESYNTKIEGLSMACQCTCIKNIFDVHVQTKVHLSSTTPLYSNSGLYIKLHICPGLTHQKSNFLLYFPNLNACCLCTNHCATLVTANQ